MYIVPWFNPNQGKTVKHTVNLSIFTSGFWDWMMKNKKQEGKDKF